MRMKADRGLAAILDSLMFVCIVSTIALMALESQSSTDRKEPWDQSSVIHSVLIHSTIPMETAEDGQGNSEAPMEDLLFEALRSGDRSLMDRLSSQLDSVADALVEASYHYRWVVEGESEEIAIGETALPDSCDIMASRIEVERGGSTIASIFYLWIL